LGGRRKAERAFSEFWRRWPGKSKERGGGGGGEEFLPLVVKEGFFARVFLPGPAAKRLAKVFWEGKPSCETSLMSPLIPPPIQLGFRPHFNQRVPTPARYHYSNLHAAPFRDCEEGREEACPKQ